MLRSDFDNHALWPTLVTIEGQLEGIVGMGEPSDLPAVERIRVQIAYVRSFDQVASTRAEFFYPDMLEEVRAVWAQVSASLQNRLANPGVPAYSDGAATEAESALMKMGPWPRKYGRGGEVTQMETLFEALLEAQRQSIAALEAKHEKLRNEVQEYEYGVEAKRESVSGQLDQLLVEATQSREAVEQQKARIDDVISKGLQSVADVRTDNDSAFAAWIKDREAAFHEDFDPLTREIESDLLEATDDIRALREKHSEYDKLVGAIAADTIAADFKREARWGRVFGISLYFLGFTFLAAAAIPLSFLLFDPSVETDGAPNWGKLIVRVSIGVLAGSAATVVIRLGARLVNNANAAKRMELEMRSVGPFLSNVDKKPDVDNALLQLVDRAFGKSYVENGPGSANNDDTLSVTTLAQLLDLVSKLAK